jgi:hypothetical protein
MGFRSCLFSKILYYDQQDLRLGDKPEMLTSRRNYFMVNRCGIGNYRNYLCPKITLKKIFFLARKFFDKG